MLITDILITISHCYYSPFYPCPFPPSRPQSPAIPFLSHPISSPFLPYLFIPFLHLPDLPNVLPSHRIKSFLTQPIRCQFHLIQCHNTPSHPYTQIQANFIPSHSPHPLSHPIPFLTQVTPGGRHTYSVLFWLTITWI